MAQMATDDELTGLYNRRYFMEALERECERAKRFGNELILCILDLDHFKKVNDTYGHPTGDMVLKEFAGLLKSASRRNDIVCRYGGEEFTVICTGGTDIDVIKFYNRLQALLEKLVFNHNGKEFHMTASAGAAEFYKETLNHSEQLLKAADDALYAAKQAGRNRLVVR
ncbi:MAG: GGDEF domain-containing protein [Proteobacteria bacterium]|nr:GGDEF domain-containing protein [Pseudomonadota bacterium]